MEKISSYISKKVISLEGEFSGYVLDVIFDEKLDSVQGFLVVDEESEETFVLKKGDIKSASESCVMIDSILALTKAIEEDTFNPINKNVYDTNGVYLGKVIDVLVHGQAVKRIITDNCEFFKRFLRKIGKKNIIFGKRITSKVKVKELFIAQDTQQTVAIQNVTNNQSKPYRIFANQNSIMGRTMQSDLYGYNNEIIAKKFDIINQNIINRAKLHNKLNFLVYYSK